MAKAPDDALHGGHENASVGPIAEDGDDVDGGRAAGLGAVHEDGVVDAGQVDAVGASHCQ